MPRLKDATYSRRFAPIKNHPGSTPYLRKESSLNEFPSSTLGVPAIRCRRASSGGWPASRGRRRRGRPRPRAGTSRPPTRSAPASCRTGTSTVPAHGNVTKKRVHKKGHHIDDEDKQKETWMTSHCLLLSRASVEEGPVGASAPAEVKAVAAAAAAGGAAEEELADAGPSPMLM